VFRPAFSIAVLALASAAAHTAVDTPAVSPTVLEDEELAEVVVTALIPRYVASTTRDRIGRVWVPVQVDGKGPFRLVLDTGAQRSAVTQDLAQRLGSPQDRSSPVMLHGVTGKAVVPTITVDSMQVGDLFLQPAAMPVVADVFGGAEGLLGTEGLQDHLIFIDFKRDYIRISRSPNLRAPLGFTSVRFLPDRHDLLMVRAMVGNLPVRAVIDTGAQATVGNLALQEALRRRVGRKGLDGDDRVQGATGEWQAGVGVRLPLIQLGDLTVRDAYVTFVDLHIFKRWALDDEPTLLIGMDLIGLVEQMVIDYRRQELQFKPRGGAARPAPAASFRTSDARRRSPCDPWRDRCSSPHSARRAGSPRARRTARRPRSASPRRDSAA
jgi:predicted aspartyl protease